MRAWRRGRRGWTGEALLVLVLLAQGTARAEKRYQAERFDVDVRLQDEGGAIVTETVLFRFEGGTFTRVSRELPLRRTDGIEVLQGAVDDVVLEPGGAAAGARLMVSRHDGNVAVTWRFPPTEGTRRFSLTYRVRGVVERTATEDLLAWTALPRNHEYRIANSRVTVEWPAAAALRTLTAGGAPVQISGTGARLELVNLPPNGSVTLRAAFDPGTVSREPPEWQQRAERQGRAAPTWALAAAGVFVVFAGLFFLLWARSPRPGGREVGGGLTVSEPPSPLPPAMAGALVSSGGSPSTRHAMAGLLDLAGRGLLQIEERPAGRWHKREFLVRRGGAEGAGPSLRPHEKAMLEAAFSKKGKAEHEVPLSVVVTRMAGSSRAITNAVRQELVAAGLLDPDRLRARRRLTITAIVIPDGLGVLFLAAAIPLVGRYGAWPLLVLAGLGLASVAGLLLAASLRPQSDEGLRQRERWKRYGMYLRRAARKDETGIPVSPAALPFAVAFGAAAAYAAALHQRGEAVPAWFQAASAASAERADAFVALMATGGWTGAGTSGGAGGAGGAAGGGSSSAS